jgi:hypothetical protein
VTPERPQTKRAVAARTLRGAPAGLGKAFAAAWLTLAFASAGACEEPADPRYVTPQATIRTLFASYGVATASEATLRARLAAHESFALRDRLAYRGCFADFVRDEDEGAAGFVFGRLIAVKDHLVFRTAGDHATLRASADSPTIPTVHLRRRAGAFRIVLRESVPAEVRAQLRAVFRRQRERLSRQGLGSR